MNDQAPLFALKPTPAWQRGDSSVWQHSWCGALAVVAGKQPPQCCPDPSCEQPDARWWSERCPVGPFAFVTRVP